MASLINLGLVAFIVLVAVAAFGFPTEEWKRRQDWYGPRRHEREQRELRERLRHERVQELRKARKR